ncbi:uncharacterized protein [Triticum aestivum]|uniref:uncharacterized protein n=1 Tax=Triticum aestivum TaxID=4565 RepID=UPI001D02CFB5|nr:uncharacterized protein LOC123083717 [Triticum aestivum]
MPLVAGWLAGDYLYHTACCPDVDAGYCTCNSGLHRHSSTAVAGPHPSLSTRLPTSLAFVAASAGPPQLVPAAAADPPRLGRRGPPRLRHLACHASTPPSPVRHLAFSSASSRRSSANGPSLASLLISPCESEEGVSPIHEFQQALNLQAHPYSRCSVLLHPFMKFQ